MMKKNYKNNYKKIAAVACVAVSMVSLSGCELGGIFAENNKAVQTDEDGEENKIEKHIESKTQGYDVTYAGVITGYSEDITVYSQAGEILKQGKGAFEWISDSMVKVVFDGKNDSESDTYIVSQDKVVIHMNEKEEIKEADNDSKED